MLSRLVVNVGLLNKLGKLPKVDKILASRAFQISPQLIYIKKGGGECSESIECDREIF